MYMYVYTYFEIDLCPSFKDFLYITVVRADLAITKLTDRDY